MTMPSSPTPDAGAIVPTQADRDTYFALYLHTRSLPLSDYRARDFREKLDRGKHDGWEGVQIVARHRLATEAAAHQRGRSEAIEEAARLRVEVAAWRQQAINEGWSHRLADAYGREEYGKDRAANLDDIIAKRIENGLFDYALAKPSEPVDVAGETTCGE